MACRLLADGWIALGRRGLGHRQGCRSPVASGRYGFVARLYAASGLCADAEGVASTAVGKIARASDAFRFCRSHRRRGGRQGTAFSSGGGRRSAARLGSLLRR